MKWTLGITVVCVAMMAMGAHGRADDRQSPCTRMGHTWVEFWNGRDVTTAFDVFTQDIVYEDVALGVVAEGAQAFEAFAQGFFAAFPQATFTFVNSVCHGQHGVIEWTVIANDGRVTPPASGFCGTGKRHTGRGVALLELRGQRIARNTDIWDFAGVLRQLLPEGEDCVTRLMGLSEE